MVIRHIRFKGWNMLLILEIFSTCGGVKFINCVIRKTMCSINVHLTKTAAAATLNTTNDNIN